MLSVFIFRTQIILDAFRNIHQHRSRSAGKGDLEGGIKDPAEFTDISNRKVMFDDPTGDTCYIHLLKAVSPQKGRCHVPGNGDKGNAVEVGIGDTGDQIGRSGTAGGDDRSRSAGDPGVTVCGVGGILFMGAEDMMDAMSVFIQFIVNRENGASGITEDGIDSIAAQRLNDDGCS